LKATFRRLLDSEDEGTTNFEMSLNVRRMTQHNISEARPLRKTLKGPHTPNLNCAV